VIEKLTAAVFK